MTDLVQALNSKNSKHWWHHPKEIHSLIGRIHSSTTLDSWWKKCLPLHQLSNLEYLVKQPVPVLQVNDNITKNTLLITGSWLYGP